MFIFVLNQGKKHQQINFTNFLPVTKKKKHYNTKRTWQTQKLDGF